MGLSLICSHGYKSAYLTPYPYSVPSSVDTYDFGVWNNKAEEWTEGQHQRYRSPVLTDDGSSIFISNNTQLGEILDVLRAAEASQNPDLIFNAGMFDSTKDDGESLWGEFDVTGLEDALEYLPCF